MKIQFTIMLTALSILSACNSGRKALLPNISGKAGEVMVVADKAVWEGAPGVMLRDSLMAECPFLPQREPLYNLVNIPTASFTQMFQIHRNLILMNVSSSVNAPGIVYRYDKWAQPQIVITVNAADNDQATQLLGEGLHKMSKAIEQIERDRIINNTRRYQEKDLAETVKEFTGGDMVFPSGYKLKKKTADFLWISYETTYVQQGIFIWKYSAENKVTELSRDALVAKRNAVLKQEVPGMVEGSYMTTADIITPRVDYAAYKGIKYAELRGFWDVHGDFMGGPFVSHSFYTPDGRCLICTEAYVYAPKYDKRHYLRQVESLLFSFQW